MKYITEERLSIYSKHLKVKKEAELAAYHWNTALAGALFPAIQCLEVTLRNAIVQAVQSNPPPAAKGLYSTGPDWIFSFTEYMGKRKIPAYKRFTKAGRAGEARDANGYVLMPNGERKIVERLWEEKKVIDAKKKLKTAGKDATPDRVISSMDFGFWTNFLSKEYEDHQSKMLLWPNLLGIVFPNAPQGTSRQDIESEFNRVRELRNRLTHHEAIWKFFYDNPATGKPDYNRPVYGSNASCSLLLKHFEDLLKLIGWMSNEIHDDFIKHQGDVRFRALCKLDGLNSFVDPDKVTNVLNINKGGWGLKRAVEHLSKGKILRITRLGSSVVTIGKDFNRSFDNGK